MPRCGLWLYGMGRPQQGHASKYCRLSGAGEDDTHLPFTGPQNRACSEQGRTRETHSNMSCRNEGIVFGDRVATNANFSIRLEQNIPFESRSNMSTMMSPKTCFDIGTRCNAKEQGQISSGPALIFIGLYLWILPHDFYILRRVLSRWKLME